MSASRSTEEIAGLRTIVDRFDDVLLDQWGALHEGGAVFPAARDCVARLRAAGKRILVLSNSGKRAVDNERRLAALGLPRAEYDLLLTSGEATWRGLRGRTDPTFAQFGGTCLLITRGGDTGIVDGLDIGVTEDVTAADFLLLAGLDDDRSAPDSWRVLFATATQRRLPMLCANPDLTMFGAGGLAPAPGALAQLYESMGGRVVYVGKPHAPIFDAARAALKQKASHRILVIGDSLDHDIRGGRDAGMLTLLISGGIHVGELAPLAGSAGMLAAVRALAGCNERMPDWVIPHLTW
jgi:HAD superfamily hydrolase (TIGR01459 family)